MIFQINCALTRLNHHVVVFLVFFGFDVRRIFENHAFSLETLDSHQLVHNDIKPQNFLVKWLNGTGNLTQLDIVLTDFGLVGQNTKGGTPIFASPECFDVKTNASDIFSLGRVFLFMMLPKEAFLKFLFVPITSRTEINYLVNLSNQNDFFGLIRHMMEIQQSYRIPLSQVRINFDYLKQNSQIKINSFTQTEIERIVTQNITPEILRYIQGLVHIS